MSAASSSLFSSDSTRNLRWLSPPAPRAPLQLGRGASDEPVRRGGLREALPPLPHVPWLRLGRL